MNYLEFKPIQKKHYTAIQILVDGKDLLEMLRGEKLFKYETAGELHRGITNREYNDSILEEDGRSIIFCCNCGMPQCDSISVKIEIAEDSVIWKDFGIDNQEPFYHFGSFKFTRKNYDECVSSLLTLNGSADRVMKDDAKTIHPLKSDIKNEEKTGILQKVKTFFFKGE